MPAVRNRSSIAARKEPSGAAPDLRELEADLRCAIGGKARVDALNALAFALLEKDNPRALSLSREAARLAELSDYPAGRAWALCRIAGCQAALGQHVGAFADAKQALDLFVKLRERGGEAVARQVIGHGYFYRNQFRKALVQLEASRALHAELGNDRARLIVQDVIGTILIYFGRYDEAFALFHESLGHARRLGHPLLELVSGNKLGHIEQRRGRLREALGHFRAARALAEREEFPIWAADCLIQTGRVHLEAAHPRRARGCFQAALDHPGADGKLQIRADAWRGLGDCAIALKDWEGALRAGDTLLHSGGVGEVNCRLYAQLCLSRLALARGRAADALHHARLARGHAREGEAPLEDRLAVEECLAAAFSASGDSVRAARHAQISARLRERVKGRR